MPARRGVLLAGGLAAVVLLAGAHLAGPAGVRAAAMGVALAAALAIEIPLPRGGGIPAGHASVIAVAVGLDSRTFAGVVTVAVAIWVTWQAATRSASSALWHGGWLMLAGAAAGIAARAAGLAGPANGRSQAEVLAGVVVAGVAYLGVEALAGLVRAHRSREAGGAGSRLAVQMALLCSAALLALSAGRGWWMAAIAVLPLAGVRFSFGRFAEARRTYDQTIRALAIVPELAGQVAMGHAERTAAYVDAMAEMLGMSDSERERVVTAARLHHIGHIGLPEDRPAEPLQVARAGRDILAETGFLADVASVVAHTAAPAGAPGGPDAAMGAIVQVASTFDDLVGEDADRAPGALAIVAGRFGAGHAAVEALRDALARRPDLVEVAVGRAAPLTRAAAAAGERYPAAH